MMKVSDPIMFGHCVKAYFKAPEIPSGYVNSLLLNMAIYSWFTMIYPLNIVIFHSYVSFTMFYPPEVEIRLAI